MSALPGDLAKRIGHAMDGILVGAHETTFGLLVALFARGHVLIEGVPGTGKTLAVRALALLLRAQYRRIQFTPDLLPADVIGTTVFNPQSAQFSLRPGPIVTNVLLADEINRTPPKTQSALLEAMEEAQVTIDGSPLPLPQPFFVCATQNPIEYEGTYPLPEAQLDRFLVKIESTYPKTDQELELLSRVANGFEARAMNAAIVPAVTDPEEIAQVQSDVRRVHVAEPVRRYVLDIVKATRSHHQLALGASPRAGVALLLAAQAAAAIDERTYATPDDVKAVTPLVLPHRLIVAPQAEIDAVHAGAIIDEVLSAIAVPRESREALVLPVWLGSRAYWALALIALLCALGAAAAPFWWIAAACVPLFAAALIVDGLRVRRWSALQIVRFDPRPFALRRGDVLRYSVRNDAEIPANVTIVEEGTPLLRYDEDEIRVAVPERSEALLERSVTPIERGAGEIPSLFAAIESPLGLLRLRRRIAQRAAIRVYPDLSAVERYGSLHVRNRVIEAGLRRMRSRGGGTEVESVREWTSGDAFGSIDWKTTARRGKIMVAQYQVERSQSVMVVVDAGRLMLPRVGELRKIDYAVTAALSVSSIAALANDNVGLVAFARTIVRTVPARRSGRSAEHVARALYDLNAFPEEADYDRGFSYVRGRLRKRSLIVFFTDMLDPAAQAASLAAIGTLARHHLVVCAFMNDAAIDRALSREPITAMDSYAAAVALELTRAAPRSLRAAFTSERANHRRARRAPDDGAYRPVSADKAARLALGEVSGLRPANKKYGARIIPVAIPTAARTSIPKRNGEKKPSMMPATHSIATTPPISTAARRALLVTASRRRIRPGSTTPAAMSNPAPPASWIAESSMNPCGATVAQKSEPKPAWA